MGNINYKKLTIILIAIAILARFTLTSIYAVSGDACWHLSAARFIAEEGRIPLDEPIGRDEPFWAPPLFHLIAAGFYVAFGNFGLKLVSPIFGSACLIIGYLILRRSLNDRATFYGMAFLSFLPIMMDYSVLGYGESVLTFFVLLALYCAFEGRFLLSGVAAGLAILTKYNGLFVIPVLLYIAFTKSGKTQRWKNAG
ncbi:MAG TPA: glycosyltransferase family 39 protein, partial [Candidatus Nanoarchaeia archaeon]|nr:glycosyltransferase family 39 protein [Candidatus Nanoarchaeia archaeon]